MLYKNYKTEFWGGLSILFAIIVPLLLDSNVLKIWDFNLINYLIYLCFLMIISIVFYLIKQKSEESIKNEGLYQSKLKTYKDVISLTNTKYWHYGMSAEMIQREVDLINYISTSDELTEIKIILLHPDCNNFKERITSVNKDRNVEALISRKKNQILSFLETINALPEDKKNNIEIRFTQTYPIWILQFINSKESQIEDVDKLYLKIHLKNKHSNFSKLYETNSHTDIFNSFKNYFQREWDSAIKITNETKIPICIESTKLIKAIILDFDGVLVDTRTLKRDILVKTLSTIDSKIANNTEFLDYYYENIGRSRLDYIKYAIRLIKKTNDEELEKKLLNVYNELLLKDINKIKPTEYAIPFIRYASKSAKLFIVSTASKDEIELCLSNMGVLDKIEHIYDKENSKTKAINEIKANLNCAIKDIVFIGDSMEDILAAQNTGITLLLINNESIKNKHSNVLVTDLFEALLYI